MQLTQKHIISLFFLIALVSLLPIAIFLVGKRQDIRPRALQGYADFKLSVDTQNAQTGQVVHVLSSLQLTHPNLRVSGADVVILYEKDKFDVISVTPVTTKEDPAAGFTDSVIAVADGSFDAKFHFLRVALTNTKPTDQLPSGTVQLAKIAFRANADGAGIIKYPDDNKYLQVVGATYVPTGTPAPSLSPGPTPTIVAIATITDSFDGSTIDTTKWDAQVSSSGGVKTEGGKAVFTIQGATAESWAHLIQKNRIRADFLLDVDVAGIDSQDKNDGGAALAVDGTDGSTMHIQIISKQGAKEIESNYKSADGNWAGGTSVGLTASFPVAVRIMRVGNTIQSFYNAGGGFILLKSIPSASRADMQPILSVRSRGTFPPVSAAFDNFTGRVNWVSPSPTPGAITFSDNFDAPALDTSFWTAFFPVEKGRVEQKNGKLEVEISGVRNTYNAAHLETDKIFTGDFSITADITEVKSGKPPGADTGLFFHNSDWKNQLSILLRKTADNEYTLIAGSNIDNTWTTAGEKKYNSSGPFTVRITRTGGKGIFQVKENGNFVLLGPVADSVYGGDGRISLHTNSWEPNYPFLLSAYDNFTVEGTVNPHCLNLPVSDLFDQEGKPNSDMWDIRVRENSLVSQSQGVLRTAISNWTDWSHARVASKKYLCGDFDMQVDFDQFSSGAGDAGVASLIAVDERKNSGVYIEMQKFKNGEQVIGTDRWTNAKWPGGYRNAAYPKGSGKLRMRRQGSVFTSYYNDGSGWKLLGTFIDGTTESVTIVIGSGSWIPDRPPVIANFDNFSASSQVVNISAQSVSLPVALTAEQSQNIKDNILKQMSVLNIPNPVGK